MKVKFIAAFVLICASLFGQSDLYPIVILGSGPAGLSAAIYAARSGTASIVIEGQEPGGQITLSSHVENYPGFIAGINGFDLTENMRGQAKRFGTQIECGQVKRIDLSKRPFTLYLEDGREVKARSLVIATGASPKWLGLDSERSFIGNGVHSCATCDGSLYKDMEVVVVGGGDVAVEDAIFLANYAKKVTVIHRRDTLKAAHYVQKKAFENPRIHFIWDSIVEEIDDPSQSKITGVKIKNLKTGEKNSIPCQGVFVAIGYTPNTALFKGQLALDEAGYIIAKPNSTETSIPGVFAAGDVADSHYRQVATAVGSGAMAGIDAYHFLQQEEK